MRHLKTFPLFEANKRVEAWQYDYLDLFTDGTYKLNPETGLFDVEGDFDCSGNKLESIGGGVQFGHVSGSFYCYYNDLSDPDELPHSVGGDFDCSDNRFTTLVGSPKSVGGNFYCNGNQLTSLDGAPDSVGGDFYCKSNRLTSLVGAPKSVGGSFDCSGNKLTSLEGAPEKIEGAFVCDAFQLDSGEWNPAGWAKAWVKAIDESEEAAKFLFSLLCK